MIMTGRTLNGHPHESGAYGCDSVGDIFEKAFLRKSSADINNQMEPIKS